MFNLRWWPPKPKNLSFQRVIDSNYCTLSSGLVDDTISSISEVEKTMSRHITSSTLPVCNLHHPCKPPSPEKWYPNCSRYPALNLELSFHKSSNVPEAMAIWYSLVGQNLLPQYFNVYNHCFSSPEPGLWVIVQSYWRSFRDSVCHQWSPLEQNMFCIPFQCGNIATFSARIVF
jgi:hypothetical protein